MTCTPTDFEIARAGPDDLAGILAIYNEEVLHGVSTFDTEPRTMEQQVAWFEAHSERHPVFVAKAGGRVVGWASLSPYHARPAYAHTAEDSVYVAADWRGRAVGKALLARLVQAARDAGHHSIVARIADHSPASIALHRAAGFREIGILREVGRKFGRWLDVTVMQRLV